jgi:hypothetical protein
MPAPARASTDTRVFPSLAGSHLRNQREAGILVEKYFYAWRGKIETCAAKYK